MLGNEFMAYIIQYLEVVVTQDIPALPKTMRERIKDAIEERLMTDPIGFGKPLRYSLKGQRRLRVGDYRILYSIKDDKVIISAIKHRKYIYRSSSKH
jgi:mRNA-degrading endonuclease RelE of RelBE toxin-antitoxin system